MANNQFVNKVNFGNQTILDLTSDTVTPADVVSGKTFHDKTGESKTGELINNFQQKIATPYVNSTNEVLPDDGYNALSKVVVEQILYEEQSNPYGITGIIGVKKPIDWSSITWADGTPEEITTMLNAHRSGEINIEDYWSVGNNIRTVHVDATPTQYNIPASNGFDLDFGLIPLDCAKIVSTTSNKSSLYFKTPQRPAFILCTRTRIPIRTYANSKYTPLFNDYDIISWLNDTFESKLPVYFKNICQPISRVIVELYNFHVSYDQQQSMLDTPDVTREINKKFIIPDVINRFNNHIVNSASINQFFTDFQFMNQEWQIKELYYTIDSLNVGSSISDPEKRQAYFRPVCVI